MSVELDLKKERLKRYYAAEDAILTNQAYTLNGRSVTRASLSDIRRGILNLETEIREIEKGRGVTKRVIPMDI